MLLSVERYTSLNSLNDNDVKLVLLFFVYIANLYYNLLGLDRVSLFSPGWPRINFVDQAGLRLMETLLPLYCECWG